MDYSLLLVIEETSSRSNQDSLKTSCNKFISTDKKLVYHIGVIDYLQNWNMTKKVENYYKTKILQRQQISAVNPKEYASRWLNFMQSKPFNIDSN